MVVMETQERNLEDLEDLGVEVQILVQVQEVEVLVHLVREILEVVEHLHLGTLVVAVEEKVQQDQIIQMERQEQEEVVQVYL